ncbi:MAG: hypothetical protein K8J31_14330 [Anaerolineae bacterium]|nr:hypothetical protein [Anaerolineae bacterium]
MKTVIRTLTDSDRALLPVLAQVWGVKIDNLNAPEIIDLLAEAMLDPAHAEKVWVALNDDQRGALLALLSSGGKMAGTMYSRLFGDIRHMGAALIEREQPQHQPQSSAEALFYRGLIAQTFEQTDAGARPIIYVPDDLIPVLPSHKTAYENLEAEPTSERPEMGALEDVVNIKQADTSIVDDLTTLLAFLQLHGVQVDEDDFSPADREALQPHLLQDDPIRLAFLLGVGLSADLIAVEDGRATTRRAETRRWLSEPRAQQVHMLAEAWRSSTVFRDLWHVPGLYPEPSGLPNYDPTVARGALMNFLGEIVPDQEWWSLEEFIEVVKHTDADFQRPGGDYDSWYIRSEAGDYLRGFESWDAVEGALLEFYVTGPMHWLGLTDLADDAARLTAYGRAFLDMIAWPAPAEAEDKILVEEDGTLRVSRRVARIDRFQVARFTSWVSPGDQYTYRLDGSGIAQADRQGINTGHITAFLKRVLGEEPIPSKLAQLLQNWQSGPTASVTLEGLIVLRTTAPETLNFILETPALRRYLGAQLGPMAVIVRADQWDALRTALGEQGIHTELIGL